MSVIGFDIGNESCVIAAAKRGGVDVLLNDESKHEMPAVVSFGKKQRFFGSAGAAFATANPKSTISQIKRLIGKVYKEVEDELKLLPFVTSEGPRGRILIDLEYLKTRRTFTPVEILGMLLKHLKQIAEKNRESKVVDCVIGIPAYFTDLQRRLYLDAAQIAGLNPLRLMHDGTAIALGYGMYKTEFSKAGPTHVMFVDIGHCDTQVTVAEFEQAKMKMLSHSFDQNLGGRDFDEVLFKHFAAQFNEKYNLDIHSNTRASARLRASCEKVKKVLSVNSEASLSIDCLIGDTDVSGVITREKFENLSSKLLERVIVPCLMALNDSGLSVDKLYATELVGSGSRVPAITRTLTSFLGKEPMRTLNASECVARGCALRCAMLSLTVKVLDYEIQESFPYNIVTASPQGEWMVFPKGSPFPNQNIFTQKTKPPFNLKIAYNFPAGISHIVGHFGFGPSESSDAEKVQVKFKVELNFNGIVEINSATILEDKSNKVWKTIMKYSRQMLNLPTYGNVDVSGSQMLNLPTYGNVDVGNVDVSGSQMLNLSTYGNVDVGNVDVSGSQMLNLPTYGNVDVGNVDVGNVDVSGSQMLNLSTYGNADVSGRQMLNLPTYGNVDVSSSQMLNLPAYGNVDMSCSQMLNLPTYGNLDVSTTNDELIKAIQKENKLTEQDIKVEETKDQRNTLESFVYDTRSKLSDAYRSIATNQEKELLTNNLQVTEDWLYEDSDDESEQDYAGKLKYLKKLLVPIENRYKENNAIAKAIQTLETCIAKYRSRADSLPTDKEDKIKDVCTKNEQWLNDLLQKKQLPRKTLLNGINRATKNFERECQSIISSKSSSSGHEKPVDIENAMAKAAKPLQACIANCYSLAEPMPDDKKEQLLEPIENRYMEKHAVEKAIQTLKTCIAKYRSRADSTPTDKEDKIKDVCTETEQWLIDLLPKQLPPKTLLNDINRATETVERKCQSIISSKSSSSGHEKPVDSENAMAKAAKPLQACIANYYSLAEPLPDNEKKQIMDVCKKAEKWLNDNTRNHAPPETLSTHISRYIKKVERNCNKIIEDAYQREPVDLDPKDQPVDSAQIKPMDIVYTDQPAESDQRDEPMDTTEGTYIMTVKSINKSS